MGKTMYQPKFYLLYHLSEIQRKNNKQTMIDTHHDNLWILGKFCFYYIIIIILLRLHPISRKKIGKHSFVDQINKSKSKARKIKIKNRKMCLMYMITVHKQHRTMGTNVVMGGPQMRCGGHWQ